MKERNAVNDNGTATRKLKKHRLLKAIMPLLTAIYGLCLPWACGFFLKEDSPAKLYLLSDILELISIVVTLAVIKKVLPKFFPNTENYSVKRPDSNVISTLIFVIPIWVILKYRLIYFIMSTRSAVALEVMKYSAEELKEELIASVSAVFLAPISEELCFRFVPLSVYDRKRTRIIVCVVMALLFSIIHVRNMASVFLDALLFGFIFLKCRNIGISIFAHAYSNFFITVLAVMSYFGAEISVSMDGPLILIISPLWSIIIIIFGIVGMCVQMIVGPRFKKFVTM